MKIADAEKRVSVSYEDPESLRLKCNCIVDHKLAGIMFWEYSSDSSEELLRTIDACFRCTSDERSLYQVISEEHRTV